jgi:uncharacterized repeat protein (TIGR01451 family)
MRRITLVLLLVAGMGWTFSSAIGDDESAQKRPGLLSRRIPAAPVAGRTEQTGELQPVTRRPAGTFDAAKANSPAAEDEVAEDVSEENEALPDAPRTAAKPRPNPTRPTNPSSEEDPQGHLNGSSITQRMDGIRRRAVDSDLSRSFVAEEPRGPYETKKHGPLPSNPPILPETEPEVREQLPVAEPTVPSPSDLMPTLAPELTEAAPSVEMPEYPVTQDVVMTSPVVEDPSQGLLITNRSPSISFETAGPPAIVVGREATYRVAMMNTGDMSGKNIVVTVRLPSWTEIISTSGSVGTPQVDSANADFTTIQWQIAEIKAKGKEELTLRLVPRDSRPFDLAVGWASAPEATMAQIEVREPKLEMAVAGPDEVLFGETEVYTITLSNPGSGDAENVVLNLLPLSTQHQMVGTRNLGILRAGERKAIDVELTAHQSGRLQVKALAYADGNLRSEVVQEVTVRRPALEVALLGPPRNFAATPATYRIRVENTGDAPADETTVLAVLPSGADFISSTDGGKVDVGRNHLTWNIGSLRPGAVRLLEMQVNLATPGDNRLDVQCNAARSPMVAKAIVTHVDALADLKIFVNDPQGAIPVGTDSNYEVRIVNRGTKAAENVQLTGFFSEGIEPISIHGWRGQPSTGQVAFAPIPSVAPGQEIVVRIVARAQQPGNHVFRAELTCATPETRLAAEEWTKYYLAGPTPAENDALSSAPIAEQAEQTDANEPMQLQQR